MWTKIKKRLTDSWLWVLFGLVALAVLLRSLLGGKTQSGGDAVLDSAIEDTEELEEDIRTDVAVAEESAADLDHEIATIEAETEKARVAVREESLAPIEDDGGLPELDELNKALRNS